VVLASTPRASPIAANDSPDWYRCTAEARSSCESSLLFPRVTTTPCSEACLIASHDESCYLVPGRTYLFRLCSQQWVW
jgi:hypothetical protein